MGNAKSFFYTYIQREPKWSFKFGMKINTQSGAVVGVVTNEFAHT